MKIKQTILVGGMLLSTVFGSKNVSLVERDLNVQKYGRWFSAEWVGLPKPKVHIKESLQELENRLGPPIAPPFPDRLPIRTKVKETRKSTFSVTRTCPNDSRVIRTDESRLQEASQNSLLPVRLAPTGVKKGSYDNVLIKSDHGSYTARQYAQLKVPAIPDELSQNLEMDAEFFQWMVEDLQKSGKKVDITQAFASGITRLAY